MKKDKIIRMIMVTTIAVCMVAMGCGNLFAQESISSSLGVTPYPSKGQSVSKQNKDEGECYAWAKKKTGIDPIAVSSAPPPESGPAVGGGEAAGGAAIGAIAGDAGKGAGAGAVVGTMAGGRQARQAQKDQQQQAQDAKAGKMQKFNKAFGACMEGRGYIVK